MFNKKIVLTKKVLGQHEAKSRSKNYQGRNTNQSILNDLRPINVLKIEKTNDGRIKAYTRGKRIYLLAEKKDFYIVQSMQQVNRSDFEPSTMRKV